MYFLLITKHILLINHKCVYLYQYKSSDCHSLNYLDRGTENDMKNCKCKPIIIEDDVLIGTGSYILKGVHIGARSIIGAGSIVTSDIPADSIAAGNPARVIRKINQK